MSEHTSTGKRSYSKALRKQQSAFTREIILRALNDVIAEIGILSFTIDDVAEKAGVSHRSVYRHFASKEALLEALYEFNAELIDVNAVGLPAAADGIPSLVGEFFDRFDKNPSMSRATNIASVTFAIKPKSRQERDEAAKQLLKVTFPNLDATEMARAFAVIRYLLSGLAWQAMSERFGLDGQEARRTIAWALDVVIRDLSSRNASAHTSR